jgi:hypothetical protein
MHLSESNKPQGESPAEAQQKSRKLNIDVTDLQRFYADLTGMKSLSLGEIKSMQDKEKDNIPKVKDFFYNERESSIKEYYKRFAKWFLMRKDMGLLQEDLTSPRNHVHHMHRYALDSGPLTLHYIAFLPALELLASKEQHDYWVPRAKNLEITGAYAQSELEHGSDVSSLQTTATYDSLTREFVVNTPHEGATKFWPGGLGKTANHVILYARLIS